MAGVFSHELVGLTQVDASIALCHNLQELDLSDNRISKITNLSELSQLKKLVMANNGLTSVDGLDKCASIEHLFLQGNKIANFDVIEVLGRLPRLKSLYLRNLEGSASNPSICFEHILACNWIDDGVCSLR